MERVSYSLFCHSNLSFYELNSESISLQTRAGQRKEFSRKKQTQRVRTDAPVTVGAGVRIGQGAWLMDHKPKCQLKHDI